MDYKYTKYQVPRGSRPDAVANDKIYLIKRVSILHATYQIRLLTYMASTQGKKLILCLPEHCKYGESLRLLMNENKKIIKVERM